MNHQNNETYTVRACTGGDLEAIMALQETVCKTMEDPDLFVPSEREENAGHLAGRDFILGCFCGETLVAYCSVAFPGAAANNCGWDLGWGAEQVCGCAKVDSIVVDAAHRGKGLQRRLLREAVARVASLSPDWILLTTVSPLNQYSLRNVQAEGFRVLTRLEKYGGKDRFILGRTAAAPENTETAGKLPEAYSPL